LTQDAIVYRCLDKERAEVVVTRATACGSNCASCEACVFQNELKTVARNLVGARPGQKVLIESKSSRVYGAIMLVYIVPILLAVLGCFLAYGAGASEGVCVLCTFLGFILGAVITVVTQRMKKDKNPISFDIISIQS
jgi:sigma-E factor negative regulatory protein RseC